MREWAAYSLEESGERRTLVVTGPLLISTIGALDRELRVFEGEVDAIDLSQAGAIDTVGAWTVLRFARDRDPDDTRRSDASARRRGASDDSTLGCCAGAPRCEYLPRILLGPSLARSRGPVSSRSARGHTS